MIVVKPRSIILNKSKAPHYTNHSDSDYDGLEHGEINDEPKDEKGE